MGRGERKKAIRKCGCVKWSADKLREEKKQIRKDQGRVLRFKQSGNLLVATVFPTIKNILYC